eukprot:376960-Amphidinium_carterae.1
MCAFCARSCSFQHLDRFLRHLQAVLDWDLKSQRQYADGPMVQMVEHVVNIFSKTQTVPGVATKWNRA